VVLSGCFNLDTLDYPQSEPTVHDVAGIYLPDEATLKDIRERGHYPKADVSITLSSDGTFVCKNIPDWWLATDGKASGGFVTKTGAWKTVKDQDWWAVGLEFNALHHFESQNLEIYLVGAKPPFVVRIVMGDPDSGNVMDFARAQ
jgi:hypothetical protein